MVAKNKNRKSAARGTKAEGSVRLGSEFITREDLNERFPICKMAQDVINALKLGGDKSSAFHLTNCFRGFSKERNKPQQPSPCQAGTRLPISQDLVVSQILRRKAS